VINTADYIDHTDADTYFGTRLYVDEWTAADDGDKESALHMATQAIDCLPLKGWKAVSTQVNAFPRYIPLARGGFTGDGTTVPQAVIDACCEEALEIIKNGASNRRTLQDQGVSSMKLLDLAESYLDQGGAPVLTSRLAKQLMHPYIAAVVPIV